MPNTLNRGLAAAILCGALAWTAAPARAADLVVVDVKGANLQPGQTVDGTKPLTLGAGQRVTLIAPNGRTIKLTGPFDQAPAPETAADAGGVVDSLRSLVSNRSAGTSTLGVVRSGAEERPLPEPWLIEVSKSGDRCLLANAPTVFWREDAAAAGELEVRPADRSWKAHTAWPASADKLRMPSTLPLRDGQTYQVETAGGTASLTFHVLPATITSDPVRAAWLLEKGCERQAAALVKTIP